ncbi:dihydropteroate synthase [Alloscardovia theropitheci]|uniref:Dihydropteroate synthase n=1 Tax=Alloscardovia theropitheci TaxID=2496842 RepID=A0A4R0QP98_9BIFI|nr:dihydropteroate synthase [Alloscardovia theropitheci]TCD54052.1 dihydropteroate synthase [Alloscardovia theropitheci]
MSRQDVLKRLTSSERTLIMGVLNITEDSFSDGGRYLDPHQAFAHAKRMISEGADIIDIGAESTRPGAIRVLEEIERKRIVTAVKLLHEAFPEVALSIDTTRASVAQAALECGAHIINDVSGGQLDSQMADVVAQSDCLYIVQHWRAWLGKDSERDTTYYVNGVVRDTYDELKAQVEAVLSHGVKPQQIIIDPGLGFSKPTIDHNLPLLMHTQLFTHMGYPVLIGASRKRFVAGLVHEAGLDDNEETRDDMTAALSVIAAQQNAWAVRVHNVERNRAAVQAVIASRGYNDVLSLEHNDESDTIVPNNSDDSNNSHTTVIES